MTSERAVLEERDLRVGDLIEVRSLDEILATLDEHGELESLPFMPEMIRFCGQRLTVHKTAHKVCDTINRGGMRKMRNAVHLSGARCDGSAHGGCQAACLMHWKTAWLKPIDSVAIAPGTPHATAPVPVILTAASRRPPDDDGTERYRCQATEILRAAPDLLTKRDLRQYVDDVRSGNASVLWAVRGFIIACYDDVRARIARRLPTRLASLGKPWRTVRGTPGRTPTGRLDLQPGEVVRIRSRSEVARTVDDNGLNRGLGFDSEMARSCGKTGRVARRVDHIIDESSGRMLTMRQPCVVLEDVVCEGAYHANCPRSITPYWRELWLERVEESRP